MKKVLIVDENMSFAIELAEKLESMNIESTITNDPKAAAVLINELGSEYFQILDRNELSEDLLLRNFDIH